MTVTERKLHSHYDASTSSPPRLRVAMMLESDEPGGAEMMVFRLSDELRRRGHTVVPVGPEHGVGWLVELTALVGHYNAITTLLNAMEVSPAPDAERLLVS